MPIGQSSSTFLSSPEDLWGRLTDFTQWQNWLWIPKASNKGLGDTIKAVKGEGETMQLGFYCGDTLKQECRIKVWDPPKRLMIALEEWNPESGAYIENKKLPGRLGLLMGSIKSMKVRLSIDLAPAAAGETKVDMRIEVDFTHWLLGAFFNLFPLQGELKKVLDNFLQGFARSLQSR